MRFAFNPGDWVLMRQKRPGKLLVKALGPYKFRRYKGARRVVAELEDAKGKILESSVANLIPTRGNVQ